MFQTNRSIILLSLMLLGAVSGPVLAKPSDMRNAYEDGWKWYVHRRSQGADTGELVDILQTLKKKYGHTYFNLDRVDRALGELDGNGVSASYDASSHEAAAAARAAEAAWLPAETPAYTMPAVTRPAPPVPQAAPVMKQPEPALPVAKQAAPASQPQDPFERYLASQQAKVKAQEQIPPPVAAAPPKVSPPVQAAVPDAPLQNPAAQAKIDELSSPDDIVKVKAAQALGDMREPGAVGPLIRMLGGDSTFASMAASAALAKIGKPALQPVMNALQDANPNVRIGACVALGDMHDPAIGPALQKATLDRDSRVRRAASTALSKIKPAK